MGHYDEFKRQVLGCAQSLTGRGFLMATGGNISVRIEGEEALAITPSNRDYHTMQLDDICVVDWQRTPLEGALKPSIETAMHVAIYQKRPDVNAVVHTHQPYASIYALINEPIPALFDEQVLNLGNVVEIVPYAVSGSVDLIDNIVAKLDNQCNAYVIQNHGILCLSTTVDQAVRNAEILEKCARVYYYAMTTGKEISRMPAQMEAAIFEMLKSEQRKEVQRKREASPERVPVA